MLYDYYHELMKNFFVLAAIRNKLIMTMYIILIAECLTSWWKYKYIYIYIHTRRLMSINDNLKMRSKIVYRILIDYSSEYC